jgi:hypothetical protein
MNDKHQWHKHDGTPCPFHPDQLVGVRISEGFYQLAPAKMWGNCWTNGTITHYIQLDNPAGITRYG